MERLIFCLSRVRLGNICGQTRGAVPHAAVPQNRGIVVPLRPLWLEAGSTLSKQTAVRRRSLPGSTPATRRTGTPWATKDSFNQLCSSTGFAGLIRTDVARACFPQSMIAEERRPSNSPPASPLAVIDKTLDVSLEFNSLARNVETPSWRRSFSSINRRM